MAGFIQIRFQIAGQAEVNRRLATFGQDITDLSPAWQQVGQRLLTTFAQQFGAEGGQFGAFSRWAPLADSTVRDRIRLGYGGAHPILVRTGALMASTTTRGAAGNVFDVQPMHLTVGTTDFKARFHQYGTSRIPARPIIGISWNMRSEIVKTLNEYVQERVRAAGLRARGLL